MIWINHDEEGIIGAWEGPEEMPTQADFVRSGAYQDSGIRNFYRDYVKWLETECGFRKMEQGVVWKEWD